jgi:hypothetical protein
MNELQALIVHGMRGFFDASDTDILKAVAEGMKSGRLKLFVQGNAAFCLLAMPQNALDVPQVLHFFSAERSQRRELVGKVLDFVKKSGYNTLRAINGSSVSDDIWTRAFRYKGWKIKPVKTVFEFEVEK